MTFSADPAPPKHIYSDLTNNHGDGNRMISKKLFLADISPGQHIRDVFAVTEARKMQAKNGPFWHLKLQDRSGRMDARLWSPQSHNFQDIPVGAAMIQGTAQLYNDTLQIQIDNLEIIPAPIPSETLPLFALSSDQPPADLLAALENLCENELHHKPWRKFCLKVLRTESIRAKLLAAYGAKAVHHAYLGGLLEHTLNVCRLALSMADNYPNLDREIILVAAVFHDLGKAWELSAGMSADYTDEGRLLGHILMTLEILDPFLKKETGLDPGLVIHLKHIIASHHGEYEFGSPKRPKTGEAFVLHYADNLDAKLNIFDQTFAKQEQGPAWSVYQKYLDRYLFFPQKTPRPEKKEKDKIEGQRLLPFSIGSQPTDD